MKISKFENFNIPGLKTILYIHPEDVAHISKPNENGFIDVILKPGKSWNEIYFTQTKEEFRILEKNDDSGTWYEVSIKITNPRIDADKLQKFEMLREKDLLILLTDMNNIKILVGNQEQPVKIKTNTALTGNSNNREIIMSCFLDNEPPFVNVYDYISDGDFNDDFNDDFLI